MMKTEVKERPILFSGEMVRAILEGRKTQTRRVVKPQPWDMDPCYYREFKRDYGGRTCPYGQPGDRLWVRETLYTDSEGVYYKADDMSVDERLLDEYSDWIGNHWPDGNRTIVSIHMPRWASRITLEITNIRVERLQEISCPDVLAEGVGHDLIIPHEASYNTAVLDFMGYQRDVIHAFRVLWNTINGKKHPWDANPWDANPWVWVIEFKVVQ